MFNKDDKNISANEAETVIGPSIKVKGNFHGEGSMIIEGEVEGSVKTKNYLLMTPKSKIIANIQAKNAKISGMVKGNLIIEDYLEITSTAKILGDISALKISIEKGATLNGVIKSGEINNNKNETLATK